MSVRLGKPFPEFSCETSLGFISSFHEWIGDNWAILFSHPADFTPVCTTELARVAQLAPEFARRNTKLIAVSVDSAESHRHWIKDIVSFGNIAADGDIVKKIEEEKFPYPIIDDSKRKLIDLLGMEDPDELNRSGMPLAARAVFIIGPDRKLKLSLLYPATTGRNFDEILRALSSLQLTAAHPVATPADWHPGDACMVVPSLDNEAAQQRFGDIRGLAVPSGRNYLRMVNLKPS
ncbi:unnamed protein product [Bursaphelenchus okinawaensis]|uniref:1-Cys peroxiredoxin n=1 Tax=Bursaphelenchus okinawaensis TaxID=465554 RepID=A0A811LEZ1_9BILA|nr:unnamed protein product [Bursaphelenchus okinawaensis]CAG9124031.1 unnamed protein product [Bursaphelenchus okinawaensis]